MFLGPVVYRLNCAGSDQWGRIVQGLIVPVPIFALSSRASSRQAAMDQLIIAPRARAQAGGRHGSADL